MIRSLFVLLALSGCVGGAVAGGMGAVATVASWAATAAPILTDVATAACAAQAAANAGAAIAIHHGEVALAAKFSTASTITGVACAW